jgi:hypothetical protein
MGHNQFETLTIQVKAASNEWLANNTTIEPGQPACPKSLIKNFILVAVLFIVCFIVFLNKYWTDKSYQKPSSKLQNLN